MWVRLNMMAPQKSSDISIITVIVVTAEGSLEIKFPTIWTDGKAEVKRDREEKE